MNFYLIYFIKLFFPRYWKLPTYVVYNQAKHETGNFTSAIYKENNNLFGMKVNSRPFDVGENRGHAKYLHSVFSIIDYFLRQKQFKITYKDVNQYIDDTVKSGYAEDKNYANLWTNFNNNTGVFYKCFNLLFLSVVVFFIYFIIKNPNGIKKLKNLF